MIEIRVTCRDFTEASVLMAKCAEGIRLSSQTADVLITDQSTTDTSVEALGASAPVETAPKKAPRKKRTAAAEKAETVEAVQPAQPVEAPAQVPQAPQVLQTPAVVPMKPQAPYYATPPATPDPTTGMPSAMQQARLSLEQVVQTLDMPVAYEILSSFGCESFSGIPEDRYSDFVAACNARLSTLNKAS